MATISAPIEQALEHLEADIPDLRRQHPDDFWDAFQARAARITDQVDQQEEAPMVAKRLDAMLAKHNLGPADPGA